jgi:polyisoprenoid-binding protein YceI
MKLLTSTSFALLLLASAAYGAYSVEVTGGTAAFSVGTNIPAITIHGKSKALTANATVSRRRETLTIENVDANLPVESLTTGMGMRDKHMRQRVFTGPDGQLSDLVYRGGKTECAISQDSNAITCSLKGELAIRGVPRPLILALNIRENSSGRYRVVGEGAVRLTDYGIDPPRQLGVRVDDQVQLRFEFMVTASPTTSAARGQ